MATSRSSKQTDTPDETRLDSDVTKPATTAPGDAPADTTDPTERASTRVPDPGKEAAQVGTVNGVVPIETPQAEDDSEADDEADWEEYEALKPDNRTKVTVRHNIRTGESKVV